MIETLITFLLFILASSAWIFGVHVLFEEGHLLEKVGIKFDEGLPNWINKPVWKCPICMASLHGTTVYCFFLIGPYGLTLWVPFCICLAGFQYCILNFFRE